jgi:hypothetical protein
MLRTANDHFARTPTTTQGSEIRTGLDNTDRQDIAANDALIATTSQVIESAKAGLHQQLLATNESETAPPSAVDQTRVDGPAPTTSEFNEPATDSNKTFDDLSQLLPFSPRAADSEPRQSPINSSEPPTADQQQLQPDEQALPPTKQARTGLEDSETVQYIENIATERAAEFQPAETLEPVPPQPTRLLQEWLERREINLAKALLEPLRSQNVTTAEELLVLSEEQVAELCSGLKALEKKRFARGLEELRKTNSGDRLLQSISGQRLFF